MKIRLSVGVAITVLTPDNSSFLYTFASGQNIIRSWLEVLLMM